MVKIIRCGGRYAAAGIMVTACSVSAAVSSNTSDLAHCYEVNACKGHNDCGTADNSCEGKSSCKGDDLVAMPTKACSDIGGSIKDE